MESRDNQIKSAVATLFKATINGEFDLDTVDRFEGIYDMREADIPECFGQNAKVRIYDMNVDGKGVPRVRIIIKKVQICFMVSDRYSMVRAEIDRLLQLAECSEILELFGLEYETNPDCNIFPHYHGQTIIRISMRIGNSTIDIDIGSVEDLAPVLKRCGFMPICKVAQKDL